jgi:curved DNA-binding protein CbpA
VGTTSSHQGRHSWQEVRTIPDADLYRILDVPESADVATIRASYRRLARRYHPDARSGESVRESGLPEADALRRMTEVNHAWEVLRDPVRRAAYDARQARAGATSPGATSSGGRSPGSRSPGATSGSTSRGTPSASGPAASASSRTGDASAFRGGAGETARAASNRGGGTAASPRTASNRADGTATTPRATPNPGDGAVLTFGRYAGWSLVELARRDPDYLEWLDRSPAGRSHRDEIDVLLRRIGRRGEGNDPLSRTARFRG